MRQKRIQIPIFVFLLVFLAWIFITPSRNAFVRHFGKTQTAHKEVSIQYAK